MSQKCIRLFKHVRIAIGYTLCFNSVSEQCFSKSWIKLARVREHTSPTSEVTAGRSLPVSRKNYLLHNYSYT